VVSNKITAVGTLEPASGSSFTVGAQQYNPAAVGMTIYGSSASAGRNPLGTNVRNYIYGDFDVRSGQMVFNGNPSMDMSADNFGTWVQPAAALKLSASTNAANAQGSGSFNFNTVPWMQLQGSNASGVVADFKVQISGGILKVTEV
jgi:hypothetical protein